MSQRPDTLSSPAPSGLLSKVDKKRLADAGMAAFVAGLKGAKAILDSSSIPGASAVFSVLLSCIDEAQKASRNADILKSVRAHLDAILEILKPLDAIPESQQDHDVSHALKAAALDLAIELSAKAEVVKEKTTHNIRPAWLTRSSDEEALQDFVRTIEDALKQFQLAQGNRIERCLETIKQQTSGIRDDVEVIKENTREIRRRGSATEKDMNTILHHAQAIEDHTKVIDNSTAATFQSLQDEAAVARQRDWEAILRDFRRAPLARYNAERPGTITGCSDQTRVEALQDIDKWIADPKADKVYWLKERAGYGKSAIAVSVAERAAERGDLAASFFFSHQVSDLNNASLFFPTLAFQLAQCDQGRYQELFVEAIKKFPDPASAKLNHQAEALFVKPLQQAQPPPQPLVIVVDALDECNREHAKELVDLLIPATQFLPIPIRLFITSRPEHHLITAFKWVDTSPRTIADTSREDVELYLRKELADIPRKLDLPDLLQDWILEEDIVILVERADGLFVYASTALRFIGDPVALNPRKRLKILLLEDEARTSTYQPYEPLDRLYQRILDLATSKQKDLIEEVHIVLGARIALYDDPTIQFMAHFLAIEVSDIRRTLVKLQSVVVCPETDDGLITFHHASFKDFLLDSSRSSPTYFIGHSIPHMHHRLAIQSFQIIAQSSLGEEVETVAASNEYISLYDLMDLKDAATELRYAVETVFRHSNEAPKDITLRNAFDTFFRHGALWWLEDGGLMFHAQDIIEIYTWRITEESPPDGLIVLNAFGSLLPTVMTSCLTSFLTCYVFTIKELRRYFRVSSQYPEGSDNTNATISNMHQRVRNRIGNITTENRGPRPDSQDPRAYAKASVRFAGELEAILDDFMLSMGNREEVDGSRRYTQILRYEVRDALLEQCIITQEECDALEPKKEVAETSTEGDGASDSSDRSAPGDVGEAVALAKDQRYSPSGL